VTGLLYIAGYDNQDMEDDVVFDGGYQVPGSIFGRLFDYQKTGMSFTFSGVYLLNAALLLTAALPPSH